jgi:hypothetical protein
LQLANEVNSSVPVSVAEVLQLAMATNPAKRPASAGQMRMLLSDAIQKRAPAKSESSKTILPPSVLSPALPKDVQEQESATIPPTIAAISINQENLNKPQGVYLEYWTEFGELIKRRNSFIVQEKPSLLYFINFFPFGRSRVKLSAYAHERYKWIGVGLVLYGADAKPRFHLLHKQKADIENELGMSLEWKESSVGIENYIYLRLNDVDPNNRQNWPDQHLWLLEKLEMFHNVFAPKLRKTEEAVKVIFGSPL